MLVSFRFYSFKFSHLTTVPTKWIMAVYILLSENKFLLVVNEYIRTTPTPLLKLWKLFCLVISAFIQGLNFYGLKL
jgi:hypothetical protein